MAIMKFITKNSPDSPYETKYHDTQCYSALVQYVTNYEKTKGFAAAWGMDVQHADSEMRVLAALYHKDSGVLLRHWVVSFQMEELVRWQDRVKDGIPGVLMYFGSQLTKYYAREYQIMFGVHWVNEENPHIHIVMNPVSFLDGHKFHGDRDAYHQYEKYAKEVLGQYGICLFTMTDTTAKKFYL